MNGLGEALGTAGEGTLMARAVEPVHGEGRNAASTGHTQETACLNCGTPLVGSHCHSCGQAAHVHRTIGAFFHDLLHGVFHFEGKIWRTLPLLAFDPGRLTREYIDGRRASYVSPIALFLFVVFLTFAALSAMGGAGGITRDSFKPTVTVDGKEVAVDEADEAVGRAVAVRETARKAAIAKGKPVAEIDKEIADLRDLSEEISKAEASDRKQTTVDVASNDALGATIDRNWRKAKENPELLIYKLQNAAYKYSWALIPISVPFMWLMFFWRRRFGLYDHTVFVTYSLTFMLLLLLVASIATTFGAGWLSFVLIVLAPVHIYRHLRGTYAVSRGGGIVRTVLVSASALLAIFLWILLLVGMMLEG